MKLSLRMLSILALGVASLAVARPAQAGPSYETVTATFGTPSSMLTTPFTTNSSSAFALFNPNQGTLLSVTVVLTQTGSVSSSVNNQSPVVANNTYSVYSYDQVIATGLDGKLQGSSVISNTVTGSIATQTLLSNLGAVTNVTASSNPVQAIDISKYIGTGTATMNISGVTYAVGAITGGDPNQYLTFGGVANYYGNISVTYAYTPSSVVPEPASLAMVALGLGAVTIAGRRARRRLATI